MSEANGKPPPTGWFWGENAIFSYAKLLHVNGIAVYCYLRRCANSDGQCWPTLMAISEATGVSKPTVIRALQKLCQIGAVRVARESDGRVCKVYQMLMLAEPTGLAFDRSESATVKTKTRSTVKSRARNGKKESAQRSNPRPLTRLKNKTKEQDPIVMMKGARTSGGETGQFALPGFDQHVASQETAKKNIFCPRDSFDAALDATRYLGAAGSIRFDRVGGHFHGIDSTDIANWQRAYVNADVAATVQQAEQWLMAELTVGGLSRQKPGARKHEQRGIYKSYRKFLVGWLNRENDRGKARAQVVTAAKEVQGGRGRSRLGAGVRPDSPTRIRNRDWSEFNINTPIQAAHVPAEGQDEQDPPDAVGAAVDR